MSSPTQFVASASSAYPITAFQIYVDNNLVLTTGNQLNTWVNLPSGSHYVVVQSWDSKGNYSKAALNLNVANQGVTIVSPVNGARVSSPTQFVASASSPYPITAFQIYVDNNHVLTTGNQLNTWVNLPGGSHYVVVQAWDSSGNYYKSAVTVSVTTEAAEARDIEKMSGWQWCTATLNGQPCASGLGDAISWMAQYQDPPSLDGGSTHFFISGSTGYSNALWWKSLGPAWNVNHLQYDFWVFLRDPGVSQALEFDANIASGGTRWVFGTECNFKDTKRWDVWDGGRGVWVPHQSWLRSVYRQQLESLHLEL